MIRREEGKDRALECVLIDHLFSLTTSSGGYYEIVLAIFCSLITEQACPLYAWLTHKRCGFVQGRYMGTICCIANLMQCILSTPHCDHLKRLQASGQNRFLHICFENLLAFVKRVAAKIKLHYAVVSTFELDHSARVWEDYVEHNFSLLHSNNWRRYNPFRNSCISASL